MEVLLFSCSLLCFDFMRGVASLIMPLHVALMAVSVYPWCWLNLWKMKVLFIKFYISSDGVLLHHRELRPNVALINIFRQEIYRNEGFIKSIFIFNLSSALIYLWVFSLSLSHMCIYFLILQPLYLVGMCVWIYFSIFLN